MKSLSAAGMSMHEWEHTIGYGVMTTEITSRSEGSVLFGPQSNRPLKLRSNLNDIYNVV